jgi:hypothetical protein
MASSDGLAGRLDHAAVSAVEAAILAGRVGEVFAATVIDAQKDRGTIQLDEFAVTAPCDGRLKAGEAVSARLVTAEIATGTVRFTVES